MADVVIVGCKLPHGLLLQVGEQRVRLNGRAQYAMPSPTRKTLNTDVEFDGLTTVDKKFWEAWVASHSGLFPPYKKGFIYASSNRNEAVARAKDTEKQATGVEPMDPNKPAAGLEPTDETKEVISKVLKSSSK